MSEQEKSEQDTGKQGGGEEDFDHNLRPPSRVKIAGWALLVTALWAGLIFAFVRARPLLKSAAPLLGQIALRRDAERGDARAEGAMGDFYFTGLGVKRNYAQAMSWHRKAADQGYAHSEAMVGAMYERGLGVAPDYAAALDWYRKAAVQGNPLGETGVGRIYYVGEGVAQDYVEALKWLRPAADRGATPAQLYLGESYRDGHGVAADTVQAYMWYSVAAQKDKTHQAEKERAALALKMTPEQIAEAQRLAESWQPVQVRLTAAPGEGDKP